MITIKTLPAQWEKFINEDEFIADKPRLKDLLSQATFSAEGATLRVLIPVHHIMQEKWFKDNAISDISAGFTEFCGSKTGIVIIDIVHDKDFVDINA